MSGMFFNMSKEEIQAEYRGIIARIRDQLAEMDEAMDKQNNSILVHSVFSLAMEAEKLSALERFAPLPFECAKRVFDTDSAAEEE